MWARHTPGRWPSTPQRRPIEGGVPQGGAGITSSHASAISGWAPVIQFENVRPADLEHPRTMRVDPVDIGGHAFSGTVDYGAWRRNGRAARVGQ
jgi:hypothetical protein